MTSTTVGWVLVEGHDADGTILDHDEFEVHTGGGARAVKTAKRVAAEVLRAQALATANDHPLRVIGVTWSADATAEAALLLESLTDAGFDNVVPVQSLQAVETLARAIAPVIGYEQTAVCVVEHDSATVVMVDICDGETQTAVKQVRDGHDALIRWLTAMFDRSKWQPAGVVVVGSDHELDAISWQLEKALPVPVFAQSDAQLAVARGAARAAASTEFTDAQLLESVADHSAAPARSRPLSHAGALTMLVAGAVTFVASLSLAVGLRVTPAKGPATVKHVVHPSAPHIAEAVAPPVPPPAEVAAPTAEAAVKPPPPAQPPVAAPTAQPQPDVPQESSANAPAAQPITPPQQQPGPPPPAPPPPEPNPHPLLTRILERIHGGHQDVPQPESLQDQAPAQVPPAQPPNPGAPSP